MLLMHPFPGGLVIFHHPKTTRNFGLSSECIIIVPDFDHNSIPSI